MASVTEYPLPSGSGTPNQIVEGPDGNLWFVDQSNKIGTITPTGTITEYKIPFNGTPGELRSGRTSASVHGVLGHYRPRDHQRAIHGLPD